MILADNRLKQPTMVSLIIAVFVSFGLGVIPSGADVERKGGSPGKAGLSQVAKDFQNPGRSVAPDEDFMVFGGCINLIPPCCSHVAGATMSRTLHLPRLLSGAVRGRAPPVGQNA